MADTKIYAGKEGIQELWRRIKSEIGKFTAFQKANPAQDGTPDVALADRKTNIIYLVLEPNAVTPDLYKEWIWTLPEEDEGEWICIGDTSVDLSGYALKSEMSVTQGTGVDADKTTITLKDGTSATVLNAHQDISGKVDKVDPHGVSGIIPSFSLTGDLMSSGLNVSDVATKEYCSETYKPKQTAVSDPTASGNAVSFIDSISQDANGVITATKKTHPLVTQDNTAGLMSSADKIKLDGIEAGAEANVQSNWGETNPESPAYIVNKPGLATQSVSGLMSQYDKQKLDGIESGAQVNTIASISVNGAPQIPDQNKNVDLTIGTSGGIQGVKLASASEPITPDASDIVTIPNATSASSQDATNGLMTASDKQKLDGVSTGANKVEASTTPGDGSIRVDGSSVSVYVHPTTAGNKHVPAGGAEYNILCYGGSSGVAVWDSDEYEDVDIVVPEPVIDSVTINGKTYPVVKIGNLYWMAENLDMPLPNTSIGSDAFNPSQNWYVDYPSYVYYSYYKAGSVSYYSRAGGTAPPVEGHGLLYNWNAVKYINDNASTLLPSGWRIPTLQDLNDLHTTAGGYTDSGLHLKSTSGWNTGSVAGNGDDSFGFNGLPTGYRNTQKTSGSVVPFQNINESAGFWSISESASNAYLLTLYYNSNSASVTTASKVEGRSIRLVMDAV